MIRLDDISKQFRRGKEIVGALDGVSLEIPAGRLATVRGPSGSGKTTLIHIAAGLMRASSGSVHVAGTCLDGLSPRGRAALRARRVAVVFQMFHLLPYLTALENVLVPTLASAASRDSAGDRAGVLMAELGIDHRRGHYPDEMSVGERQRVALARALLNEPEVILADEPTGNLDPKSADKVLDALSACRDNGATVLLVTHHPIGSITADLEYALSDGRLQS